MTESQAKPRPPGTTSPYRPVIFVFVVFAAVLTVVGVSKMMAPKDLIPWRTDFAAAQVEARAAGKPMFAYFSASWCAPCQEMKRTTWSDGRVEEVLRGYVPVKIDIDQQAAIAQRYAVGPIPAYVVLNVEGRAVGPMKDGLLMPEEIVAWLEAKK